MTISITISTTITITITITTNRTRRLTQLYLFKNWVRWGVGRSELEEERLCYSVVRLRENIAYAEIMVRIQRAAP